MQNHDPSRYSRFLIPVGLIILCLVIAGCNYPGIGSQPSPADSAQDDTISLEAALLIPPEDRRPTILAEMGAPDAFSISFDTLNGQVVRSESWSYFDFNQRFDFIDGELLWTAELEPVPDGSLYAHFYTPESFGAHMSSAEVRDLMVGQSLEAFDLAEGGVEGGMLLVGDQILLGFEQDRLVYVETLILEPDGSPPSAAPPTNPPTPTVETQANPNLPAAGSTAPAANGAALLVDSFDAPLPLAQAYLPEDLMPFEHVEGLGRLESKFNFLPTSALYDLPALQDFIAEFDLITRDLAPGAEAGLVFRYGKSDNLTHLYAVVLRPNEKEFGLKGYMNKEYFQWDYRPIPETLISPDGVYRVRMEVQASRFRVFINGAFVAEFNDAQITEAGSVGLYLVAMQTPQAVYFDNLQIYQVP